MKVHRVRHEPGLDGGGTGSAVTATRLRLAALVVAAVVMGAGVVAAGPALAAPPSNDDISQATLVTALPFSATQDSVEATTASSDPSPTSGRAARLQRLVLLHADVERFGVGHDDRW